MLKDEEIVTKNTEHVTNENKLGIVTDCHTLNVRKEPSLDAELVCTISCGVQVTINDESTEEFYKVCIGSEIEGFCMKKYIAVQQ